MLLYNQKLKINEWRAGYKSLEKQQVQKQKSQVKQLRHRKPFSAGSKSLFFTQNTWANHISLQWRNNYAYFQFYKICETEEEKRRNNNDKHPDKIDERFRFCRMPRPYLEKNTIKENEKKGNPVTRILYFNQS